MNNTQAWSKNNTITSTATSNTLWQHSSPTTKNHLVHNTMSLLHVPKFSTDFNLLLLSKSKIKQEASVIFYILGFLSPHNDWQRLICTSGGLRDLVVLRAHVSAVHDVARPWLTIHMNNENSQVCIQSDAVSKCSL